MSEDLKIKIPSAKKLNTIRELLVEDEEFRFPRIKLDRDKPRFHLPEPLEDDDENVEIKSTFRAVVLIAKKNFYQSDEDKKEGKAAKEKRELYLIREGKFLPELVYVNPTSLRPWRELLAPIVQSGRNYHHVLVEFAAEKVTSKQTGFKWMKFTFKEVRSLTEEEAEYMDELREMVSGRVRTYVDDSALADLEDQALGESKPKKADDDEEDDDPKKHSAKAKAKIEADDDDEEDEKPKSKKKAKVDDDDDDEEEKPKSKKKAAVDDDDDEEEKPKSKKKSKVDDDDDEDLPKGKSKAKELDDDEDEDEKPKSKKKSTLDDDDEDLDELVGKKKTTGKKKAASLDDEDDD